MKYIFPSADRVSQILVIVYQECVQIKKSKKLLLATFFKLPLLFCSFIEAEVNVTQWTFHTCQSVQHTNQTQYL